MGKPRSYGAEWLTRFEEQRRELNPQKVDKLTPELAQVLAQRVSAHLLALDEKLRTEPESAALLLRTARTAIRSILTIGTAALPAWATDTVDPWDGLPEQMATELAQLNTALEGQSALHMALQRISSVLPLAQAEARKLGVTFDAKTPGALEALRECLKAYRAAWRLI